jgi:uncharacterized protein (TIGR02271 family)
MGWSGPTGKGHRFRRFVMVDEESSERFAEEKYSLEGYQAYDLHYDKIGKVDDLFVDEHDNPEYVGVKIGFLGARTTLIPIELVRINDKRRLVEVEAEKNTIKEGPAFGDDREITHEFERRVLDYYRVETRQAASMQRETYGPYYPDATDDEQVDALPGERAANLRGRGRPGESRLGPRGGDTEHGSEDEVRVQRIEEDLRVSTRQREAGGMRVRKRVRTDRERLAVPKKRQEVRVERVPAEEGAPSEPEIGDDEIRIPVVEEEIVIEKRPVVKEEIRLRKEVVEEEEIVEEDVRKEEIDIEDQTKRRRGSE